MTDVELLADFEACVLPPELWTHAAHIRVAWCLVSRHDFDSAFERMRRGLRRYNAATGVPEVPGRGYHETITRAFMLLVSAADVANGPWSCAQGLFTAYPDLLRATALDAFYSEPLLRSAVAKETWVKPDLQPLPTIEHGRLTERLQPFLEATPVIDWQQSDVIALAQQIKSRSEDRDDLIRQTFEFVRDEVRHSVDYDQSIVTCCASEVLAHATGFCYSKSHLLAALLRANGIPTGFCYQRLSVGEHGPPFCLHGLNAVFLPDHGWYRLDARGNKPGVSADFRPPHEKLAFEVRPQHERDFYKVLAAPLDPVVAALQVAGNVRQLAADLPDVGSGSDQLGLC